MVIASQRVRPKVAGPMTSSAKQSRCGDAVLDCFVASLLAMTEKALGSAHPDAAPHPAVAVPERPAPGPAAAGTDSRRTDHDAAAEEAVMMMMVVKAVVMVMMAEELRQFDARRRLGAARLVVAQHGDGVRNRLEEVGVTCG